MSKKKVKNVPEDELKIVTGGYGPIENPNDPSESVNDSSNKCSICGVSIVNNNKSPDLHKCFICYLKGDLKPINSGQ